MLTILSLFFLTGCYSEQKQQLASCELRAKSDARTTQNVEIQNQESSEFVEACMRAGGYEFDDDYCPAQFHKNALLKRTGNETTLELGQKIVRIEQIQKIVAGCYQPVGWLGKKSLKFERLFGLVSDNSN